MSGARQCGECRGICPDDESARCATRSCAFTLCESEWFAGARTIFKRPRSLADRPRCLRQSDHPLHRLSSSACFPSSEWAHARTRKHKQTFTPAAVLQRHENRLHRRCGQMPDRKRNASWQRCNRCCAGRQLQQDLARRLRAAFVGPVAVTADDGIRTRDLRFTKPLLYQLSYVGGKRAKHCIQRRFTQARYKGTIKVSPISRSTIRSAVLPSAASKRSIGSRKDSRLSRNV